MTRALPAIRPGTGGSIGQPLPGRRGPTKETVANRTRKHGAPARRDASAWTIIDILPGHPYITAPIAVAATSRSRPQVYEAVEQLETAGVLQHSGNAGRARVYEADGLITLLAALERGDLAE